MTAGVVNVLKPPGMTSHDVVSFIRRTFGIKRVGHAGTLDPAAAGVLPVFIGQATRLVEYQAEADKDYRAELTFGYETDTGDDTGRIIATGVFAGLSAQAVAKVLETFRGTIRQIPPAFSAVKIAGKKMYEMARQGIEVECKPREVRIYDIKLLRIAGPRILFDVTCSKGTYIRSLCRDIGIAAGCPAVMSFLVRTRVGNFSLANAFTLEEIIVNKGHVVLPADIAVSHLPALYLSEGRAHELIQGKTVTYENKALPMGPLFRVYDSIERFIGIGQYQPPNRIRPVKIFSSSC